MWLCRTICLIGVFIVNPTFVLSANHYVCDCAIGADNECIAGNDGNSGLDLNSPKQSYEQARMTFTNINTNDAVLFCQGGAWDINSGNSRWVNGNCDASNRCIIGSYLPNWASGDEARPILRRLDGANGMDFVDGGDANHEEGYLVSGLHLIGTDGSASFGMFFYNDIDDVDVDDVRIESFQVGFHLAGSNPCDVNDPLCDGKNDNIYLSNSEIVNNREQGWLGGSDNSSISNNQFLNNGNRASFDHNIYVSGFTSDMVVRNNTLKYSALDTNGDCQGTSLVVHGTHHNLLIEGNFIEEDLGMAGFGCWGIAVDGGSSSIEVFTDLTIRNNTIKNLGNLAIGVGSCQNCWIENNIIIQNQAMETRGIMTPDRVTAPEDAISTDVIVRNNTIYFGLNSTGTGITIRDEGINHQMVSNVIYYAGIQNNFNCLNTNLTFNTFTEIDNNLCYFTNAVNAEWADGFSDLSAWQNSSGFDGNSLSIDPEFNDINGFDFTAASAFSPMVDAGHPTLSSALGINAPRDQIPDMGAYEHVFNDLIFAHGFEL